MGHTHRAALGDLMLEDGNHGAVRPQHIAKAHGGVAGILAYGVHILYDDLRQSFGGAHHIGGVYRLVGGENDHLGHFEFVCRNGHVVGAEHIVFNRLAGRGFHQRHMLVGGSVEHHIRVKFRKHFVQPLGVPHGTDAHIYIYLAVIFLVECIEQLKGAVLVNVKDHDLVRVVPGYLHTDLGPDGATAPGNQNCFADQVAADLFVQSHLRAGQQVGDLHISDPLGTVAVLPKLLHGGRDFYIGLGAHSQVYQVSPPNRCRRGNAKDDFINFIFFGQP